MSDYLDETEADRGDLLDEVDRLRVIETGIRALHVPSPNKRAVPIGGLRVSRVEDGEHYCVHDNLSWPCPTAALLNPTEQAGGAA